MPYLRLYGNSAMSSIVCGVTGRIYSVVRSLSAGGVSCSYVVSGDEACNGMSLFLLFSLLLRGSYGVGSLLSTGVGTGSAARLLMSDLSLGYFLRPCLSGVYAVVEFCGRPNFRVGPGRARAVFRGTRLRGDGCCCISSLSRDM